MSRFHLDVTPARLQLEDADGFTFEYRRRDNPALILLAAAWLAFGWTLAFQLEHSSRVRDYRAGLAVARRQSAVLERQERAERQQQERIGRLYDWLARALDGQRSYPATERQ